MPPRIHIVSGVTASLGASLIEQLSEQEGAHCFGLHRRDHLDLPEKPNVQYRQCDLCEASTLVDVMAEAVALAEREGISEIVLSHAVGPFKYEGDQAENVEYWRLQDDWLHAGSRGIDPDIFKKNVHTFHNAVAVLMSGVVNRKQEAGNTLPENMTIKFGTFGSVTEHHQVPLWFSFLLSKYYICEQMKALKDFDESGVRVGGFYLRTSTIDTGSERDLRPLADDDTRAYWLSAEEVAARAIDIMERVGPGKLFMEDLIRHCPDFRPGYYSDPAAIKRRWDSQIGADSSGTSP